MTAVRTTVSKAAKFEASAAPYFDGFCAKRFLSASVVRSGELAVDAATAAFAIEIHSSLKRFGTL